MAIDDEMTDVSFENPLRDDVTRDAAAQYPITQDELDDALGQLQNALVDKILKFYDRAWLHGGEQNHLLDTKEGVFFAFTPTGLYNKEPIQKLDIDNTTFKAAIDAHQNQAAKFNFDVDRPTEYSDTFVDDFHPIYIEYPEGWQDALYHARQQVLYLLRHDLTPTEALDYWALKFGNSSLTSNRDQDRWRANRDVDPEAIYKSKRQAREKLEDEEHQPYYPEQNIETVEE